MCTALVVQAVLELLVLLTPSLPLTRQSLQGSLSQCSGKLASISLQKWRAWHAPQEEVVATHDMAVVMGTVVAGLEVDVVDVVDSVADVVDMAEEATVEEATETARGSSGELTHGECICLST